MEAPFEQLGSWCTEHIRSVNMGMDKESIYSNYTAHISLNRSHFLTARVFVYSIYKVIEFCYGQKKSMVNMNSNYTAHISSNGSHFLMALFLMY